MKKVMTIYFDNLSNLISFIWRAKLSHFKMDASSVSVECVCEPRYIDCARQLDGVILQTFKPFDELEYAVPEDSTAFLARAALNENTLN